jgi:hypothetical protein
MTRNQTTIPNAVKACYCCEGTKRLVSISQLLYVLGAGRGEMKASKRVLVCESCLVSASLSRPGTQKRERVAGLLLSSVTDVYKRIRGVA